MRIICKFVFVFSLLRYRRGLPLAQNVTIDNIRFQLNRSQKLIFKRVQTTTRVYETV